MRHLRSCNWIYMVITLPLMCLDGVLAAVLARRYPLLQVLILGVLLDRHRIGLLFAPGEEKDRFALQAHGHGLAAVRAGEEDFALDREAGGGMTAAVALALGRV